MRILKPGFSHEKSHGPRRCLFPKYQSPTHVEIAGFNQSKVQTTLWYEPLSKQKTANMTGVTCLSKGFKVQNLEFPPVGPGEASFTMFH